MDKCGKCECNIEVSDIIKGAVIGAGIGIIVAGVANIIKSNRLKEMQYDEWSEGEDGFMDEIESLERESNKNLFRGIRRIIIGTFTAAVGAFAFTKTGEKLIEDGKSYAVNFASEDLPVIVDKVKVQAENVKERALAVKQQGTERFKKDIIEEAIKAKVEEALKNIDIAEKVKAAIAKMI